LRACLAALEIRQAVDGFNLRHQCRTLPTRIGLDVGWVAMGHVGGSGRFAYDVTGDTANTASRIEGMNKYLGTTILASETVVGDLDGLFLRRMGSFRLKGKSGSVSIFEIIARRENAGTADVDLCTRFAAALSAFESKRWSDAAKQFAAVLSEYPADGPARFYLERSGQYSAAPPPDDRWIIEMGTK
jgi:adenylate cyclase